MSRDENGSPARQYIDILVLVDGEYRPEARVWDDGRFDADCGWARTLIGHSLIDPLTGTRQPRGPGLLRAIASRFNNGYVGTSLGAAVRRAVPPYLLPESHARRDPR